MTLAMADRLTPEVPTSSQEVRERLEALEDDLDVLLRRTGLQGMARPLRYLRAEVRALIAFYDPPGQDYDPPPSLAAVPDAVEAPPVRITRRKRATNDADGTRRCARCQTWKPREEFGTQGYCRPCVSTYNRERYLAITKNGITVELMDGDEPIGGSCPECGKRFASGDRVVGTDLHHETCHG